MFSFNDLKNVFWFAIDFEFHFEFYSTISWIMEVFFNDF